MPSILPIPSLEALRTAFHNGVKGFGDSKADGHLGSVYDHFAGASAILWSQQGQRDADMFQQDYFNYADGDDLTNLVQERFGISRVLDTAGTGRIFVRRDSVSLGAGTFYKGTRITITGKNIVSKEYAVSANTLVGATVAAIEVPIEAVVTGSGSYISLSGPAGIKFSNYLWDNTWTINQIDCLPGTDFEQADDFRARVKLQLLNNRVGYAYKIQQICRQQGAVDVITLRDDFGGSTPTGVSAVYVGDISHNANETLVSKCTVALEDVRVLGADLAILPIEATPVIVNLTISLSDTPFNFPLERLTDNITNIVLTYFASRREPWLYKRNAIVGAIVRNLADVQDVTINTPSSDASLNSTLWPSPLPWYYVNPNDIAITFIGPT